MSDPASNNPGDERPPAAAPARIEPARIEPPRIEPGAHPPVVAGQVITPVQARAQWPTVVGVLSMVLGVSAALNAMWTLFWGVLGPFFLETIGVSRHPQFAASYQTTRDNALIILVNGLLALVLGCMITYAGLRIMQRRRAGVRPSINWAWCKIAFAVFTTVTSGFMGVSQFEATKQQMMTPGMPAFVISLLGPIMVAGYVFWFLWLNAYPVFTLIWFRRAGVREDIAAWPT